MCARCPEVSPFSHQRELLASKVLQIGRSLLTGGGGVGERKIDVRAEEAVRWLQKAFSLAEHLDDTLTAGAAELKVGSCSYWTVYLITGRIWPQRCILRNLGSTNRSSLSSLPHLWLVVLQHVPTLFHPI